MWCGVTEQRERHLILENSLIVADFIKTKHIESKVNEIMSGSDMSYFKDLPSDMNPDQIDEYDRITINIALSKNDDELKKNAKELNKLIREVITEKVEKGVKKGDLL